jgi:sterol desaturase/sphingolipid hydroxylase (fatty acid hydroxylase superfamily)
MERMIATLSASRTNYWLSYVIDASCAVVLGYLGVRNSPHWAAPLLLFGAGACVFTFVEYALHRWLFHAPGNPFGAVHQSHHARPAEPTALPFPSSPAAALVLWSLLSPLLGPQATYFVLCGLLTAYFYYAVLHHLQHSVRIKAVRIRWLRTRWIAHAVHHGRLNSNFGVTSSFWDRVLGTYYPLRAL